MRSPGERHPWPERQTRATETRLLHQGGRSATWGNLGLWPADDYASACEALARRVGNAAALVPGQRVLSPACGSGDELVLWRQAFGVAQAEGTERNTGPPPPGPFDAVVCVDAAYHFSPRAEWLAQAWAQLRPGGHLAFTDLVLDRPAGWLLRAAARLCGLAPGDLVTDTHRLRQLQAAGFESARVERLDAAVLAGFVAFEQAQRQCLGAAARGAGWRRVRVTARLIPACRAAGLGYALFSAHKP